MQLTFANGELSLCEVMGDLEYQAHFDVDLEVSVWLPKPQPQKRCAIVMNSINYEFY